MKLTHTQLQQIRLISDTDLYQDAERFLAEHGAVERNQVEGLRDYARSLSELEQFVRHQSERDWQGRKEHYRDFYNGLSQYLQRLRQRIKEQYQLVPEGLAKKEAKEQVDFFASLLAQEFLQHLASELVYKSICSGIVSLRDTPEEVETMD